MKNKENIGALIFTVVIGVFLILGAWSNFGILTDPTKGLLEEKIDFPQFITEVKDSYIKDFKDKERFINLNGLFARITGRHVYNEVSVLKNGMLDYEKIVDLDMTGFASEVDDFSQLLEKEGIKFTYVQVPIKSDMSDTLIRSGIENYGNQNAAELLALLDSTQTNYLDLRTTITPDVESVEKYFYNTDHHWNTHGAFTAYGILLEYLREQFPNADFDLSYADEENWNQTVYKDWFLGSRGKRVGIYYGGIDDLTIYTPKFATEMSMYVSKYRAYTSGSFEDAVIKKDFLDTPDYFNENPYCSYIGGDYPLVYHKNELAKNDLKVLIIKDSFSLPLQAFLSTSVRELEVLDPRYYTESTVAEYVAVSQPDIVLMMVNPSVFGVASYSDLGVDKGAEIFAKEQKEEIAFFDTLSMTASADKNYFNRSVANKLDFHAKYTLDFASVDVVKGDVEVVTALIYNATTEQIYGSYVFDLSDPPDRFTWTFMTPKSGSGDLRLLVYAGRHSATAGNHIIYNDLHVYRYK